MVSIIKYKALDASKEYGRLVVKNESMLLNTELCSSLM